MATQKNWIDVDLAGFGQLMADRPKVAVLHDLLQNVFDEDATHAEVSLHPHRWSPRCCEPDSLGRLPRWLRRSSRCLHALQGVEEER